MVVHTHGARRRRGVTALLTTLCAVTLGACTPSLAPGTQVGSDPFASPVVPSTGSSPGSKGETTSSQSGALDAPTPRRGHGTVRVAHPEGTSLPAALVEGFTRTTGFDVVEVPVPVKDWESGSLGGESADVLVDLDETQLLAATQASTVADAAPRDMTSPEGTGVEEAPAGITYARDDVCVLADAQWFAANRRDDLPTTLADLTAGKGASLLNVPDPTTTTAGRAFVQFIGASTGGDAAATMAALLDAGAHTVGADQAAAAWTASARGDAQSGARSGGVASAARPLTVGPVSQIAASETNTGTEAAGRLVGGTCVRRNLYAAGVGVGAGNEDGAQSWMAYLLGREAQQVLADTATAYPLDAGAVEDTPAQWFLTPSDKALGLSVAEIGRTAQWMTSWKDASSHR